MLYLDNAATTFPKAPGVSQAVAYYLNEVGASVNRGVYASAQAAGMTALRLRRELCGLMGHSDPTHCVLTPGNTWSLNMVLLGALGRGGHCLVSAMEHNAVMRPLRRLADRGVTFDRIPCDGTGRLDLSAIPALIRPDTRLLVMAHGSNVSGTIQDAAAVGEICRQYNIPFVLDAAQTAGHMPMDFAGWNLAALAAPGHKGLLGPSGTGVLLLRPDFARALEPVITGGTGSASHTEEQPDYMPDKFEPGTPNLPGIYGLEAAVSWILQTGVDTIRRREEEMCRLFLEGLARIPNIRLVGSREWENRAAVFSLDFRGRDNAEVAFALEQEFGVLTRCGLHCAPAAHHTLGTYPQGTVRLSPGPFTTDQELTDALTAIDTLARRA